MGKFIAEYEIGLNLITRIFANKRIDLTIKWYRLTEWLLTIIKISAFVILNHR